MPSASRASTLALPAAAVFSSTAKLVGSALKASMSSGSVTQNHWVMASVWPASTSSPAFRMPSKLWSRQTLPETVVQPYSPKPACMRTSSRPTDQS